MIRKRFKLLSIILSYVFFIFVIIISINAVVPEKDLQVLEPKEILVEKVNNNFLRDKNSVYEILEKDNHDSEKIVESEDSLKNILIGYCDIDNDEFEELVDSFLIKSIPTSIFVEISK